MEREQLDWCERFLEMMPVFTRLADLAQSALLQAAESGHELSKFKITKGRCSRDWNADAEALVALLGEGIYGERSLLTVAAAEKKFGKAEVKSLVKTTEGGLRLVPKSSILNEVSLNCSEFS